MFVSPWLHPDKKLPFKLLCVRPAPTQWSSLTLGALRSAWWMVDERQMIWVSQTWDGSHFFLFVLSVVSHFAISSSVLLLTVRHDEEMRRRKNWGNQMTHFSSSCIIGMDITSWQQVHSWITWAWACSCSMYCCVVMKYLAYFHLNPHFWQEFSFLLIFLFYLHLQVFTLTYLIVFLPDVSLCLQLREETRYKSAIRSQRCSK